jgi:uncharacterized membrane protein
MVKDQQLLEPKCSEALYTIEMVFFFFLIKFIYLFIYILKGRHWYGQKNDHVKSLKP